MKKVFTGALLLLCCVFLVRAQQEKNADGPSFKGPGAPLPGLRVVDTGGKVYTEQSFENEYPFFLVLFNPTCEHCEKMAKLIGNHAKAFKQSHILFMAVPPTMPYMSFFYQGSGIGKHPGIVVGVDSAAVIDKLYEYVALPQINVYDKDRKLIKAYYGDTPIDSLTQYVR